MADIFSDTLCIQYDPILQRLTILKGEDRQLKLFDYKLETLKGMGFEQASKFLGEGLLLLIPECRAIFLPETRDASSPIGFISKCISILEREQRKSADQFFELSKLYLIRSRLSSENADLVHADKLIREAARLGSQRAAEILRNGWDGLVERLPNKG